MRTSCITGYGEKLKMPAVLHTLNAAEIKKEDIPNGYGRFYAGERIESIILSDINHNYRRLQ